MITWAAQAAAPRCQMTRRVSPPRKIHNRYLSNSFLDDGFHGEHLLPDRWQLHLRTSVRPSVLSPSNPSERWRFTTAVLRRRRPHYFPGRSGSHGLGDTSSCLSSCPLWLYKICDTSARRAARTPRARLSWNSPCAPPTASSLPLLCGWIQKLRNHSGSEKQNCFMFLTE